eukprot:TRINITY_DN3003_c0_g1_i1.p1 TRINITY_DN3003_c0_g1~~TRINITY_DN3003_c0_g1_i1.p1  ORF type:complete len:515 (+),score=51.30 TRINITY_DN3003_c0_g1_i1:70-1614(+)
MASYTKVHSASMSSQPEDKDLENQNCCPKCPEKCVRCGTHTYFFFVCCWFVLWSSLPRISAVLDGIVTLVLYLIIHRSQPAGRLTMEQFWHNEVTEYRFSTSAFDIFVMALVRCILLFFLFAYKLHGSQVVLQSSVVVVLLSSFYLVVKLIMWEGSTYALLIFSLACVWVELGLYLFVRGKRLGPPRPKSFRGPRFLQTHRPSFNNDQAHILDSNDAAPLEPSALADPDSQFMDINGVNVHYKLLGQGPHTLVFLHGYGSSVFAWKQTLSQLQGEYQVLAFDRPGFGLTSRPLDALSQGKSSPYTNEFSVTLTLTLMERLNIQRAVLVGHSTGGMVATMTALQQPQRVSGLVLISPTILSDGIPNFIRSVFRTKLGKSLVSQLIRSEIGEFAIRRAWFDATAIPQEVFQNYQQLIRLQNWDEALLEMTRVNTPPNLTDVLKNIECPTLILHGESDGLVPIEESVHLCSLLHDSELIRIPNCGHVPHQECFDRFTQCIHHFIQHLNQIKLNILSA